MNPAPNLTLVSDEPVDPMLALEAERERLTSEFERLHVFGERRADAQTRLGEIDDALKVIDVSDREAVRLWAASADRDAPAPEPLLAERRHLLARRVDISAEIDATVVADAAVEDQRKALRGQIKMIGLRMLELRLADTVAIARDRQADAEVIAAKLAVPLWEVAGIRAAMVTHAGAAENAGDVAAQGAIVFAIREIDKLAPPVINRDAAAVGAFAAEWTKFLR